MAITNSGQNNIRGYGFKPGQSGNPNGRPKTPENIREMFKAATPKAVESLIEIANNPKAKNSDRIKAIDIILDRSLGKPLQAVDVDVATMPQVVIVNADKVAE